MVCRPCCTFKLLAYAKLICMGYRKVVSSPCKNHGIYEYIMRYVYRSLLLICIDSLVLMVIVVVLVAMVVLGENRFLITMEI